MPTPEDLLAHIVAHLGRFPSHVADIAIGPRREGWFNAEAFVAINSHAQAIGKGAFVAYGEQKYRTILASVGINNTASQHRGKIPDLAGYVTRSAGSSVDFVLEAKVIYDGDPEDGKAALVALDKQLRRARRFFPKATAMGVVYAIKIAGRSVLPEAFLKRVSLTCESVMPSPAYSWVNGPVACVPGLRLIGTTFTYPASTLSVGVGARVLH